jgi:hypothetical protein
MQVMTFTPVIRFGLTKRPCRGFALLITITLLAFLVLLLVSLATLTRVETQVADNNQKLAHARQNALTGLNIALGQLQRTAGPDQRVSAAADLVAATDKTGATTHADGGIVVQEGARYWTGVWGNANAPFATSSQRSFLNWLVSGNEAVSVTVRADGSIQSVSGAPDYTPVKAIGALSGVSAETTTLKIGTQPARLLVGGGTVAATTDYVVAPRVALTAPTNQIPGLGDGTASTEIGGYAYWVGDQGIKARADLVDSEDVLSSSADAETKRLRYRSPGRLGIETMTGFPRTGAVTLDMGATTTGSVRAAFRRMLDLPQFTMAANGISLPSTFLRERFHDIGVGGAGVLANTLAGGLKTDLTYAFRTGSVAADAPAGAVWTAGSYNGPAWQLLRSYCRLGDAVDSSGAIIARAQTDAGQHGVFPVVALFQLFIEAQVVNVSGNDYQIVIRHYPAVVLWNPYNVTLKATTYTGSYASNGMVFQARISSDVSGSGSAPPAVTDASGHVAQASSPYFYYSDTDSLRSEADANLQFKISSGDMAPGAAYVYTMADDVPFSATNAYADYVLTPGWHVGGGPKAITVSSSVFTLTPPVSSTDPGYVASVWISGGTNGRRLIAATADLPALATSGDDSTYSVPGSDRFILRLDGGTSTTGAVLQDIYRNNASLRSQKIIPLLRQSLATGTTGSLGWYAQKWALKATVDRSLLLNNTTNSSSYPIAWLANYNPRAPFSSRSPYETGSGYFNNHPNYNRISDDATRFGTTFDAGSSNFTVGLADPATGRAFVGLSQNEWADLTDPQVVLFDVPHGDHPVLSVGALQHAQAYRDNGSDETRASNTAPAYAIGNSLADPRVGLAAASVTAPSNVAGTATIYDHSYLLNRALWDGFFFSSVPAAGALPDELPNRRYQPVMSSGVSPTAADLRLSATAASAGLVVEGAFNINSTSVEAWRALLASANHAPVGGTAYPDTIEAAPVPYPRSSHPVDDSAILTATTGAGREAAAYRGYRFLTSTEIDALAVAVVAQVRERGPFVSLADFVNRALTNTTSATTDLRLRGALAQSIEDAGINNRFHGTGELAAALPAVGTGGTAMPAPQAHDGLTAQDLPGWVSQADLLQALGPVLSARSDTFVIRAYGDAVSPLDSAQVQGRAWCEAIVQRLPDYIDGAAAQAPDTAPAGLTTINLNLGRRFKIVSFRWLSPADI